MEKVDRCQEMCGCRCKWRTNCGCVQNTVGWEKDERMEADEQWEKWKKPRGHRDREQTAFDWYSSMLSREELWKWGETERWNSMEGGESRLAALTGRWWGSLTACYVFINHRRLPGRHKECLKLNGWGFITGENFPYYTDTRHNESSHDWIHCS